MIRFWLAAAGLLLAAGCERPLDDAAFGQRVRTYLLTHPEVLQEAMQQLETRAAATSAADAKRLIGQHREALLEDARDPVIGDRKAPVTVVEFFDYRCGYCKASSPEVLALVERNRDVRLVMKEMPILSPESEYAARAALLAAKQGKYATVHRALMAERAVTRASVDRIARTHGVSLAGIDGSALTQHLQAVHVLAGQLKVGGTPAFVVGDKMIAGADMAALQQAIAEQRRSSPRAG